MSGREKGPLTEPMYYVLMAFLDREMCGTEIGAFVERKTAGRVRLGPGTLYTLLAKFQEEGLLEETGVEGRKRTYQITPRGGTPSRRSWPACGPVWRMERRKRGEQADDPLYAGERL